MIAGNLSCAEDMYGRGRRQRGTGDADARARKRAVRSALRQGLRGCRDDAIALLRRCGVNPSPAHEAFLAECAPGCCGVCDAPIIDPLHPRRVVCSDPDHKREYRNLLSRDEQWRYEMLWRVLRAMGGEFFTQAVSQ